MIKRRDSFVCFVLQSINLPNIYDTIREMATPIQYFYTNNNNNNNSKRSNEEKKCNLINHIQK